MQLETEISTILPHLSGNELEHIRLALESHWIAPNGPCVEQFENVMADYIGVKHCVAMNSGTSALHIALQVCGVEAGDLVLCPSFTFIASAAPIRYLQAKPVFVDASPEDWSLSLAALEKALHYCCKKLKKKPKAVVVVDAYGTPANYEGIMQLCSEFSIEHIVQDAAESLGAQSKMRKCASLTEVGVISFNGNKILTTSSGGMLTTSCDEKQRQARFLINQAKGDFAYYHHSCIGYNYGMSNLLAAIGLAQFTSLEIRLSAKLAINQYYKRHLGVKQGIHFMPTREQDQPNHWLSVLAFDSREFRLNSLKLCERMQKEKIHLRPVWKPLHQQPVFQNELFFAHSEEEVYSEYLFENAVCLPSHTEMQIEEQAHVVSLLQKIFDDSRQH